MIFSKLLHYLQSILHMWYIKEIILAAVVSCGTCHIIVKFY